MPAAAPAAPAPAIQLADGTWRVQGTRVPGSRFCGEWLVHLTSAGGQLSGTLSHARNTAIPIQNLELMPDGSFSGSTPASMSGSRRAPPATVTGQFSGDTVNVTFDSERCPPRQGTASPRTRRLKRRADVTATKEEMYATPIATQLADCARDLHSPARGSAGPGQPVLRGQGPSPEDNQLLLERLGRLSAAEPALPVRVAQPAPAQAIRLADGTWTVQGTRIPGSRRCGQWDVHLTSAGGQLSGEVSQARGTVTIQNLVLMPDGSFSGTTPERMAGRRRAPAAKVTGRFSGDTVSLIFESERCPVSQGTATRHPTSG
jgi:hypothetical protein